MPRVVMVIAQEVFRDEEYALPKQVLENRGAEVVTASVEPGQCIGKLGLRAEASMSVSDASELDFDAAIFVGGAGAQIFFDDANAHHLARLTLQRGRVLAAICIAPSILARAGLLEGVTATAFPSQENDLKAHGALWSEEPVVVDGRIITANGPQSAEQFGEAVADALGL